MTISARNINSERSLRRYRAAGWRIERWDTNDGQWYTISGRVGRALLKRKAAGLRTDPIRALRIESAADPEYNKRAKVKALPEPVESLDAILKRAEETRHADEVARKAYPVFIDGVPAQSRRFAMNSYPGISLRTAVFDIAVGISNEVAQAILMSLKVGDTYTDTDGDVWRRVV